MGKKIQKRGKCIFCYGEGLTKQHVLPNWLREIFPRTSEDAKTQNVLYFQREGNFMLASPKLETTQGHLGNVRIRNVCEKCNSGWISRLENATKPIIEKMIKGNVVGMNENDQYLLSRWIILVTIMIEYTDVKTRSIPKEDRISIRDGKIPDGWKIWIGYSQNKNWEFRYRHNGACVMKKSDYENGMRKPNGCNIQFTTIGLGNMYIHTARSCVNFYVPSLPGEEYGLMQVCPYMKDISILMKPKFISNLNSELLPDLLFKQIVNRGQNDIDAVFIDPSGLMPRHNFKSDKC